MSVIAKLSTCAVSLVLVALVLAALGRPLAAQAHDHDHDERAGSDTAFAELQSRGKEAMGVDQYTSAHRFEPLPDGGRIELQRGVEDSAGVAQIRAHLTTIAAAFTRGDFTTPEFVHATGEVPGTRVMAVRRDRITYTMEPLPRGGEVRIRTTDPAAIAAIHEFLAFQRHDHRTDE